MLKVALIEDNILLRETLEEFLAAEGHAVAAFGSAEEALAGKGLAMAQVVVLDLNLPGENGITLARRLRADRPEIGIVMLTARSDPAQRQQGYESGADIYLTKPGSPGELSAAIRSLARRLAPMAERAAAEPSADLRLDAVGLTADGPLGSVRLTAAEMDLLRLFAEVPDGRLPLSRIAAVGGEPSTRGAVDVRIARLRKKLAGVTGAANPVAAVRGYGYQLTLRVSAVPVPEDGAAGGVSI